MLRYLSEALNAFGVVLWEVRHKSVNDNLESADLFVLSAWFTGEQIFALHDLPVSGTITGSAVLSGLPRNSLDIIGDLKRPPLDPFFVRNDAKYLISVPLTYVDGALGAVNLYRRSSDAPFSANDLARLVAAGTLIPGLYQGIRDGVSFGLLSRVDEILKEDESQHAPTLHAPAQGAPADHRALTGVSKAVAAALHSVEVSIILKDSARAGRFELAATTWPREIHKRSYRKDKREGITGWVLCEGKPVHIFDLAKFERDREAILSRYQGLTWQDHMNLVAVTRQMWGKTKEEPAPPLSYMAVPITAEGRTVGVIRCSAGLLECPPLGPYYFADRDLKLLNLIAARIGQFWITWASHQKLERENHFWQNLVSMVSRLNAVVERESARPRPDEGHIYEQALRLASQSLEAADVLVLRLIDPATNDLYCGKIHTLRRLSPQDLQLLRNRISLTDAPAWSLGARAVKQRRTQKEVAPAPLRGGRPASPAPNSERTSGSKWMVSSPIIAGNLPFGCLDLQGPARKTIRPYIITAATLLGTQLGLYLQLLQTLRQVREAEARLTATVKNQNQTFMDFWHQLSTPVNHIYSRLDGAIAAYGREHDLLAARGQARKIQRVTGSFKLLADLANERPVRLNSRALDYDDLIQLLIKTADDHQMMAAADHPIRFDVERDSFDVPGLSKVAADLGLLEQMISNLLDNAGKYGYSQTTVRIYGGLTGGGKFHITVANRGVKVRPADLRFVGTRGWRSDLAEGVTASGSGIGLWLVKQVMRAHGGELVVVPTRDKDGVTEVKLLFPFSPGHVQSQRQQE